MAMAENHQLPDEPEVEEGLTQMGEGNGHARGQTGQAGPSNPTPPAAGVMAEEQEEDLDVPDISLRARAGRMSKRIIPTSLSPPSQQPHAKGRKATK